MQSCWNTCQYMWGISKVYQKQLHNTFEIRHYVCRGSDSHDEPVLSEVWPPQGDTCTALKWEALVSDSNQSMRLPRHWLLRRASVGTA